MQRKLERIEDGEEESDSEAESGEGELAESSLDDSFEAKYGEPRIEVLEEKPLESTLPQKSK